MEMTVSARIWRSIAFLVRLDMAAGMAIAAGLLVWMTWH
jgi:hypothetical protein